MSMYNEFIINVAEFASHKTTVPDLYNITVKHFQGDVTELLMSPIIIRNIDDLKGLLDHIDAAAKNNYESYKTKVA